MASKILVNGFAALGIAFLFAIVVLISGLSPVTSFVAGAAAFLGFALGKARWL